MNITDFLLARIAEDEQQASNVSVFVGPGPDWQPISLGIRPRVLAECKAKRIIVGTYAVVKSNKNAEGSVGWHEEQALLTSVRAIAAVYSDHAAYQKEWGLSDGAGS